MPLSPWSRPFVFADSLAAIKTLLFIVSADDPAKTQGSSPSARVSCPRGRSRVEAAFLHQW
jgi:hypothetical protein